MNNTGGLAGGPLLDAPVAALLAAFSQHVVANHLLAQALVPAIRAAGFGRIVNVISTSVKVPLPGLGVSNTVREAVASWAKTLATELGPHGIAVNNVLPGATLTQRHHSLIKKKMAQTGQSADAIEAEMRAQIAARRFGLAAEVAAAVAFLTSPAAGYINGNSRPVDSDRTGALQQTRAYTWPPWSLQAHGRHPHLSPRNACVETHYIAAYGAYRAWPRRPTRVAYPPFNRRRRALARSR